MALPQGVDLDDEKFGIEVGCSGDFVGGEHVVVGVDVSVNGPATIGGIPTGAECEVTELDDDRFEPSYDSLVVGEVTITNTTAWLQLAKTVSATSVHLLRLDDTFEFSVSCVSASGDVSGAGTISITTVDDMGASAPTEALLVDPGSVCTVTEDVDLAVWRPVDGASRTVDVVPGENGLAFANDRVVAPLRLTKMVQVDSVLPIFAGADYEFDVTPSCSSPDLVKPVAVAAVLGHGESTGVDGLPYGTICRVVEDLEVAVWAANFAADCGTV